MLREIQKNWKRCRTYSGTNSILDKDRWEEGLCSASLLHCNKVQASMCSLLRPPSIMVLGAMERSHHG